jgi:hypothetical protein
MPPLTPPAVLSNKQPPHCHPLEHLGSGGQRAAGRRCGRPCAHRTAAGARRRRALPRGAARAKAAAELKAGGRRSGGASRRARRAPAAPSRAAAAARRSCGAATGWGRRAGACRAGARERARRLSCRACPAPRATLASRGRTCDACAPASGQGPLTRCPEEGGPGAAHRACSCRRAGSCGPASRWGPSAGWPARWQGVGGTNERGAFGIGAAAG